MLFSGSAKKWRHLSSIGAIWLCGDLDVTNFKIFMDDLKILAYYL